MKLSTFWPVIIVLSAGAAYALVRANTGSPAQVAVVVWFLVVCPGMMAVRFLQLDEPLVEWMLAVALSLAIDTFVAGFLLIIKSWSPQDAFAIIVIITTVGAVIEAARASHVWGARAARRQAMSGALAVMKSTEKPAHEAMF